MKVSEWLQMIQIGIPRGTIFLSVEESVQSNCHLIAHQKKKNHLVILIKKGTTTKCHYNPRIKEIIHLSFYESMMYLVCCVMLI